MAESATFICVALWATTGKPCDREVEQWLADVPLCRRHYWRAVNAGGQVWTRCDEGLFKYHYHDLVPRGPRVVYYARRVYDGLIKIGYTGRFNARMAALRLDHGELEILLTHQGGRESEREIHDKFRELWAEGEFYRPGAPLMDWIMGIRRMQDDLSLLPETVPMETLVLLTKRSRAVT